MNKKIIMSICSLLCVSSLRANDDWNDLNVLSINRAEPHATMSMFETVDQAKKTFSKKESKFYKFLNGKWKFNWVSSPKTRPLDFF